MGGKQLAKRHLKFAQHDIDPTRKLSKIFPGGGLLKLGQQQSLLVFKFTNSAPCPLLSTWFWSIWRLYCLTSQAAEPLFLVHFLEETLAKFVCADHDGASWGNLDDTRQETYRWRGKREKNVSTHPAKTSVPSIRFRYWELRRKQEHGVGGVKDIDMKEGSE